MAVQTTLFNGGYGRGRAARMDSKRRLGTSDPSNRIDGARQASVDYFGASVQIIRRP